MTLWQIFGVLMVAGLVNDLGRLAIASSIKWMVQTYAPRGLGRPGRTGRISASLLCAYYASQAESLADTARTVARAAVEQDEQHLAVLVRRYFELADEIMRIPVGERTEHPIMVEIAQVSERIRERI